MGSLLFIHFTYIISICYCSHNLSQSSHTNTFLLWQIDESKEESHGGAKKVFVVLKAPVPVIQEKSKMWVWTKRSFSVSNRSWFAVWKTSRLILDDRIYIIYFANSVLMTGLSSQHLKIIKQSKFLSLLTNHKI